MKHFLIIALIFVMSPGYSCTSFMIKSDSGIILGWNFDWYSGEGVVVKNPSGIDKSAILFDDSDSKITWTSKFSSITFNQFGIELPFGGINEHGLTIVAPSLKMNLPQTQDTIPVLNEAQWIQYMLDNCSIVNEVVSQSKLIGLKTIGVPIHYLICDSTGNFLVVEIINNKIQIFKGDKYLVPVLENKPYLQSLVSFKRDSLNYSCNSRFSKAHFCVSNAPKNLADNELVRYGFNSLNIVKQGSFTKWQVVFDSKNKTVNIKTPVNTSTVHPSTKNEKNKKLSYTLISSSIVKGSSPKLIDFKPITLIDFSELNNQNMGYEICDLNDIQKKLFSPIEETLAKKRFLETLEIFQDRDLLQDIGEVEIDVYLKAIGSCTLR